MKQIKTISVIILLVVLPGCGGRGNQSDDLITVDVTGNYPQKELILQDFLDVEYIPLETTDDFITMAATQIVGEKIVIVRNIRSADGDIFIYDRTGKGLRKFNRRGQGSEEYTSITSLVALDEDNNEVFVNSTGQRKVFVYDLFGNFKRSFDHQEVRFNVYINIFDRDYLICTDDSRYSLEDRSADLTKRNMFRIISKQDGRVMKEISIPYERRKVATLPSYAMPVRNNKSTPYRDSWLLAEPSSDTIYRYFSDHSMIPFIVRTPSIQSMDPEVFLFPGVLTDRYIFMRTYKMELYDFENNGTWHGADLMYDRQEKAIFKHVVYNDDFSNKIPIKMAGDIYEISLFNSEDIVFAQKLEAYDLVEAYKNGRLKGKLKEIAATLDEEDNPVIMIARNKK